MKSSDGRVALCVIAVLFVLCCVGFANLKPLFALLMPKQPATIARSVIDRLALGDIDSVFNQVDESIHNAQGRDELLALAHHLPHVASSHAETVGTLVNAGPSGSAYTVTLQIAYPKQLLAAMVAYPSIGNHIVITGMRVLPLSEPLDQVNRFTLFGKGGTQYLVLLAALASSLFAVLTLIVAIRTPIENRKWIWILLTGLSVTALRVNWTTGQWEFDPWNVGAPGGA
jgi:hypothetical protein